MRQVVSLAVAVALVGTVPTVASADRGNVRRLFRTAPRSVGVPADERWRNAADMVVEQAARYLPVPTGASDFTYRWNDATGEFERTTSNDGPLFFVDRAETIGRGLWNVGVTYQYLELDEWDGDPLLVGEAGDRVRLSAGALPFKSPAELQYHVTTINVTYGMTDKFDVNVALPLISLHATLDPMSRDPGGPVRMARLRGQVDVNVGDAHLRAKHRLFETHAFTGALGVDGRAPTGDPREALGTGDPEIEPFLAIGRTFADGHLDMQWNAGFAANLADTRLSSFVYAWGLSFQPCDWFSIAGSFLGRSEINARRHPASVSAFQRIDGRSTTAPILDLDPSRKDFFDATVGFRLRLRETLTFSAGFFRAINDDGIRSSDFSGLMALEATF